jgi:hypothetical protein
MARLPVPFASAASLFRSAPSIVRGGPSAISVGTSTLARPPIRFDERFGQPCREANMRAPFGVRPISCPSSS